MSRQWSKDEVLQAYLNIICQPQRLRYPAASKAYFDKPVDQLTVSEGAPGRDHSASVDPGSGRRPRKAPPRAGTGCSRHGDHRRCQSEKRPAGVPADGVAGPGQDRNLTTGPNGHRAAGDQGTARAVQHRPGHPEHPGPQITTTIDPQAQKAAEDAVATISTGRCPRCARRWSLIDPKTGG